jgi:uncharacterized protein
MDDDYTILHSPLEESVTRDGLTVEVLIYRGEEDRGWILEVVDARGGSTVWDCPFQSDQAAHDAAMAAITEEGISAFVLPERRVIH